MTTAFQVAYYGLTLLGLLPAAYFILTFRPSRYRLAQLDTVLWVLLVFLYLGLSRLGIALLNGQWYEPRDWPQATVLVFVSITVDVAVWIRILHWRRIRRTVKMPKAKHWWW